LDLGLTGKRVSITGASRGIGAGVAEAFAAEGADLHLAARGEADLRAVARAVRDRHNVAVETTVADLTDGSDRRRLAEAWQGVDILVKPLVHDYWDFLYYAFTIVMCFQTSDVSLNTPEESVHCGSWM
jgi:enoyl-[acyl-carrier-protein] reductase (NADH)